MLKNLKVLVVDDQVTSRKIMEQMLLRLGVVAPGFAGCGHDALEYLQACHTDLVISDLHMPGMDGLELLRAIRAEPRLRSIRFVLATGQDSGAHLDACQALDVAMILTKPIRMKKLMGCVADALKAPRSQNDLIGPTQTPRIALRA